MARRSYSHVGKQLGAKQSDFQKALDDFSKTVVPDKIRDTVKYLALKIYDGVTTKSPVDTGFFRANWNIALGDTPDLAVQEDLTRNQNASDANSNALKAIAGLKPYESVTISNNVEYAQALEGGHSGQAPAGVLGLTLDEAIISMKYGKNNTGE